MSTIFLVVTEGKEKEGEEANLFGPIPEFESFVMNIDSDLPEAVFENSDELSEFPFLVEEEQDITEDDDDLSVRISI